MEPNNPRRERGAVPQEQKGFDAISFVRHAGTFPNLPVQDLAPKNEAFGSWKISFPFETVPFGYFWTDFFWEKC